MKPFNLFLFLCVVAGCRTYSPAPIDWEHERAEWTEKSAATLHMTLADARQCALFLNPEINALRVRHLASSNAVLQTGWWDDPEVGVDALHFLKRAPHPWIFDTSLAFTIPINGVPALERKAAEAYAFADACAVVVAERELMVNVGHAWNRLEHARARHQFLTERLPNLERARETAAQLVAAGEMDAAEAARLQLDVLRVRAEVRQLALDVETQRLALVQLTGLHPAAPIVFEGCADVPVRNVLVEDALIRHPNVQEKLARLDASETDLRTEIRRQYPDLRIGPALSHEEGSPRAGMTFGMTLPLWNRNREAVAAAEGARQQARIEAVNEWKRLCGELAIAKETLRVAEENERHCREEELPAASRSVASIEKLVEAGEADVTALFAGHQTEVEAHLNWLDAKQALQEAQISISQFEE